VNDYSLFDLRGKTALVTGASTGIGRACATALAQAGANIAVLDINEDAGYKVARSLKSLEVDAAFFRCDITEEEEIRLSVDSVVNRFGRLDIAVNNVGTFADGNDFDQPRAEWDRVLNVNLTGVWLCSRTQARQMAKQSPSGGKIINIASMWSVVAGSNGSYCASKAGVVHLTKALAVEFGPHNVNVNCISPSWVLTPLFMAATRDLEAFRSRAREVIPLGHVQRPEDIHGPIMFLASSAADYVTGINLIVDGGHTLNTWHSPLVRSTPPRVTPDQELSHWKGDMVILSSD
jgi:NAD(P)-dependent dehydrogenase (short-subunit alcohol dehydrogenase family)